MTNSVAQIKNGGAWRASGRHGYLSVWRTEMRRVLKSPTLYIAAAIMFVACWSQIVTSERYNSTTALSYWLGITDEVPMDPYQLCSLPLLTGFAGGYWFNLMLVAASTLSFSVYFCDERTSGMMRFSLTRSNKYGFLTGKLLAASSAAVLALLMGYAAFAVSVLCTTPELPDLPPEEMYWMMYSLTGVEGVYDTPESALGLLIGQRIIIPLLWNSFTAIFWSLFAMAVTALKPNKYFATVLPVVACYLWEQSISRPALWMWSGFLLIANAPRGYDFESLSAGWGITGFWLFLVGGLFVCFRLALPTAVYFIAMRKKVDIGGSE